MSGIDGSDGSEAPLTERRPAGLPSSTLRAVVVIVTVLLLINIYALTLLVDWPEGDGNGGGDGDGQEEIVHPWNVTVEPYIVEGDEIWTDQDGHLEAPVVVNSNGSLRIESSHIDLLYEDFIFFRTPYITVEEGGRLEIVDSEIELVVDPFLDDCYVGPVLNNREFPQLSRVFNLTDTENPALTFDLKTRHGGTDLVVAIQPAPELGLETLETIVPDGGTNEWVHYRVPLTDYIDTDVRVVLYTPEFPKDVVLIHGLKVSDEGLDLPHDIPLEDADIYWQRDEFITFDNAFLWFGHYNKLIQSGGGLSVINSRIISPEVPRRANDRYDKEEPRWNRGENRAVATCDWNVVQMGELFEVRNSTIVNVPIEVNDSTVVVEDTTFQSGYDILTVYNCSGRVTGSVFTSNGASEAMRWWREGARLLWAISVANNSMDRPFGISNCVFSGVEQAIDLGYAWVDVEGCTFDDIVNLAVWDHMSHGIGGWEALRDGNTFGASEGYYYLQTDRTIVDTNGSTVSQYSATSYDEYGRAIRDVRASISRWMYSHNDDEYIVVRPRVLVESMEIIRTLDHTNLSLWCSIDQPEALKGHVSVRIGPNEASVLLDIYSLLKEEEAPWVWGETPMEMLDFMPNVSGGPGEFSLVVRMNVQGLYADNLTFDTFIDDELVQCYDVWTVEVYKTTSSYLFFWVNLSIEPGIHRLDVRAIGNVYFDMYNVSEELVEISNLTTRVMRVTDDLSLEKVREFLGRDDVYVLLDPGTSIQVEGLFPIETNPDPSYGQLLHLVGAENASLTLANSSYEGVSNLTIFYREHLDLHMTGGGFERIFLWPEDYESPYPEMGTDLVDSLEIDNLTCEDISLVVALGRLSIRDAAFKRSFELYGSVNNSIDFRDCTFHTQYMSVNTAGGSLTFDNCSVVGGKDFTLTLGWRMDSDLALIRCDFEEVILRVNAEYSESTYGNLSITGCTFSGEGSYLIFLGFPSSVETDASGNPQNSIVIDDNSFSRGSLGMALPFYAFRVFTGNNVFRDGARVWAWYISYVLPSPSDPQIGGVSKAIIIKGDEYSGIQSIFEDDPTISDQGYMFLDVTDDPSMTLHPPRCSVVITWSDRYHYTSIVDYGTMDPRLGINSLHHIVWPDMQGMLTLYVGEWPEEFLDWP